MATTLEKNKASVDDTHRGGSPEITRIELKVDNDFRDVIDILAQNEGMTRQQVIRKAIGLMTRLRVLEKEGNTLLIGSLDDGQMNVVDILRF
jgi:hypothetical protein